MNLEKYFDIKNPLDVSVLGYATDLSISAGNLQVGIDYLNNRFDISPLKAHEALFSAALGHQLTPLQAQYAKAYIDAETTIITNYNNKVNNYYLEYPECNHPSIEDFIS